MAFQYLILSVFMRNRFQKIGAHYAFLSLVERKAWQKKESYERIICIISLIVYLPMIQMTQKYTTFYKRFKSIQMA